MHHGSFYNPIADRTGYFCSVHYAVYCYNTRKRYRDKKHLSRTSNKIVVKFPPNVYGVVFKRYVHEQVAFSDTF